MTSALDAHDSAPVRLVIAGLGRMGQVHARCLASTRSVEVVAVADASAAAIEAARGSINGATIYADALLAFAHEGAEACLIATPTPTHPALVRVALDAGLHVLCEKPLALDFTDALELDGLARRSGKVLQVGFWRRFSPPWQRVKEAIDAGDIGQPLYVRLCQWDADPPPASFCDPKVSGGLAVDCGVHEFDLAEWLTGLRIQRVRAWSLPTVDAALAAAGDVDNLVAVCELSSGAVATVDLSRNCRYGDDVRTEVLGSLGAALVDILPNGQARLGTATGMRVIAGSQTDDATAAGIVNQIDAFAAAVRGAEIEIPGAQASARATRIAQSASHAAAHNVTVDIAIPLEAPGW